MAESSKPPEAAKVPGKGLGCSLFLILFLIGTALLGYWGYSDYVTFTTYKKTTCTLISKQIISKSGSDGATYRADFTFMFTVAGKRYQTSGYDGWKYTSSGRSGKEAVLKRFTVGRQYDCWYNPVTPREAILVKRLSWLYLIPVIMMALGLVGGVWMRMGASGPSRESRAYEKRLKKGDAVVRSGPKLKTTQGQHLAVRLGRQSSTLGKVFGMLFFSVFWNGIVSVFLYQGYQDFQRGSGFSWFLFLFMIPFVLAGIGVIAMTVHQFLVWLGVGETVLEVSADRLAPGASFDLWVSQAGNMNMNALTVTLICEERATYQQGTNTHTARERVVEFELACVRDKQIGAGQPLEVRASCQIPRDAMHSFKAGNNEIAWWINIKGDIRRWPDFDRNFSIGIKAAAPVGEDVDGGRS